MRMTRWGLALVVNLMASGISMAADEDPAAAKLAEESTAYSVETEKDAAAVTPQMIMEKVDAAAKLIEAEGVAAFPKFKGKGSEYIFAGTYIWIHDMTGVMRMHPLKHKMEGTPLLGLKDKNGKMFFVEMNEIAKKGGGWVEYVWPKPGAKEVSPKISYVKLAKHGEEEFVIGCGIYDQTLADIEKKLSE